MYIFMYLLTTYILYIHSVHVYTYVYHVLKTYIVDRWDAALSQDNFSNFPKKGLSQGFFKKRPRGGLQPIWMNQ